MNNPVEALLNVASQRGLSPNDLYKQTMSIMSGGLKTDSSSIATSQGETSEGQPSPEFKLNRQYQGNSPFKSGNRIYNMPDTTLPAVVNNNAGNLRVPDLATAQKYWANEGIKIKGVDDKGFVIFERPQDGMEAFYKQVMIDAAKVNKDGNPFTFEDFVDKFTPKVGRGADPEGNANTKRNIPLMMKDADGETITLTTPLHKIIRGDNIHEFIKNKTKDEGSQVAVDYFYNYTISEPDKKKLAKVQKEARKVRMSVDLTDESKQAYIDLLKKYPGRRDDIFNAIRAGNPEDTLDWIWDEGYDEQLPIKFDSVVNKFSEGLASGLTFGLLSTNSNQRDPFAGDIDTRFGSFDPAEVAGEVVGSLPVALSAYGVAGRLATKAGLSGGARTVAQIVGGEGSLGATQGLITSGGDMDEAVRQAAIWTSMGFMGEGLFRGVAKALGKVKDRAKLNAQDSKALKAYEAVKDKVAKLKDSPTGQKVRDNLEQYKPQWWVDRDLNKLTVPSIPPVTSKIINDKIAESKILDSLSSGGSKDGMTPDEANRVSEAWIDEAVKDIEDPIVQSNIKFRLQGHLGSAYEMVFLGNFTPQDALQWIKEASTDPTLFDDLVTNLGVQAEKYADKIKQSITPDDTEKISNYDGGKISAGDTPSFFNTGGTGQRPKYDPDPASQSMVFDDEGKEVYSHTLDVELTTPISTAQKEHLLRLQGLAREFRHVRAEDPIPESYFVSESEIDNLSVGEARARSTRLATELANRRNKAQQASVAKLVDQEIKTDLDTDLNNKAEIAKADLAINGNLKKNQAEEIKYEASLDKDGSIVLKTEDGNVASVTPDQDPLIYRQPGLLHWLKILPATARRGLSSNPLAKIRVMDTVENLQTIGRDTRAYLKRVDDVIRRLYDKNPTKAELYSIFGHRGSQRILEEGEVLKRTLVEALDSTPERANAILTQNPDLVAPYAELRQILDELADGLGLNLNQRISGYFPHLFDGSVGNWRANRIISELGQKAQNIEGIKPFEETGLIKGKALSSLRRRETGATNYNRDLESVLYTYIRGAVDKKYMDPLLRRVKNTIAKIPEVDNKGNKMYVAEELEKWVSYVVGQPTKWKHVQAMWWKNNDLFNRWVDNAVEYLGDGEAKGLMAKARAGNVSEQEEKSLVSFFNKLVADANEFTKKGEGMEATGHSLKKYRAKLALMIDDVRARLSDPAAKPVVLEKLYQIMVVNKLGFSISHGLINTTAFITNSVPFLGVRYATKGIKHFAEQKNPEAKILGRRISDIIDESGVKSDLPQEREFTSLGLGLWDKFDEVAMTPATVSEDFIRTSTFMGQYEKSIVEEGLSHYDAMAKARKLTDKTMFIYNRAGAPLLFQTPFVRFLLMFKSFTIHQTNFTFELLEDAILKGETGPFIKHIMGYLGMAGVGATILGGGMGAIGIDTRVGELSEHPFPATMEMAKNQGVTDALGGPTAGSLIELLHGNVGGFADDWLNMSAPERLYEGITQGDLITAVGLK